MYIYIHVLTNKFKYMCVYMYMYIHALSGEVFLNNALSFALATAGLPVCIDIDMDVHVYTGIHKCM